MPVRTFIDVQAPGFRGFADTTDKLISFLYDESLEGCAKWAINVATEDSGRFDRFIRNDAGSGRTFRFKFGLRILDQPVPITGKLETDWKTLELLSAGKRTWGEWTVFTFKGLCHGNVLNRMGKVEKNWKDKKISEIIKEIGSEVGLKVDVEDTIGEYTLSSGKCNYGTFIKTYLLPLAYGKKPNKDWRFWIKSGDTLVFKPINVNLGPKHYFSDRLISDPKYLIMNGPESVKMVFNQIVDGSGRQRVEVHDPKDNRFQQYEVSDSNAGFNYGGPGRPKTRSRGSGVVDTAHFTEKRNLKGKSTKEQIVHEAQTRFARNARGLYKMVAQVPFSVGLCPGDVVQVITKDMRKLDEGTGLWILSRVKNVCTRGELKCFVALERRWEKDS